MRSQHIGRLSETTGSPLRLWPAAQASLPPRYLQFHADDYQIDRWDFRNKLGSFHAREIEIEDDMIFSHACK
jgi:hypothetical protein